VVSADNPYNPYGSRFYSATGAPNTDGSARLLGAPRSVTLQSVLLTDGGADTIDVNSQVYRAVGGVRGSFGDTWTWESGLLYSWAKTRDQTDVGFRESLLGQALARPDATAFNPFGYTFKIVNGAVVADQPYRNPDAVLATVMGSQPRIGKSSIASIDFRSSGELFSLFDRTISAAVGGEFRKETFSDHRPPYFGLNPIGSGLDPNGNDFIQASPKPDSKGDRTVASVYGEVVAPLVRPDHDIPLVYSLELSASVRYEHYSDFGDTTNPKFSLNYRPVRSLMVRASENQGFTAPNLATLYFPDQFTVIPAPGAIDPYRNPVTSEGAYVMRNYTGAADTLLPTDSKGKSAGVVFDVPGIERFGNLRLSVDYWQIKQTNVIGSPNVTQLLERDAALLRAYTSAQLAAGVPIGQIDLGSGASTYKGDPSVVRNAVSAADQATFAAYNARNPSAPQAAVGQIFGRSSLYQNLSEGFVSGWDYSFEYAAPEFSFGKVRLAVDWTILDKSYTLLPTATGTVRQERLNVDGNADSRGSATLSWKKNAWSASLSGYYIGAFTESGATTTAAVYNALGQPGYIVPVADSGVISYRFRVKSSTSFNATGGYDFEDGAKLRLGIVNVFNKAPPLASTNFGYNAAAYSALAVGRTWTVELSKEF
jgi:iron complex outermembrane receptor protein